MPPRPSSSHSQGMPGMTPPQQQQQMPPQGNQNLNIPNSVAGPPPPGMDGNQMPPQPYPNQNPMPHQSYKMGPYPPQSQYSQGNYSPRAQYPNYPPNSQYPRPTMQNHVNAQYPPHAPYHQVWPPPPQNSNNPGAMTNHIGPSQGKNIGPPQAQSPQLQQQQQQGGIASSPQQQPSQQKSGPSNQPPPPQQQQIQPPHQQQQQNQSQTQQQPPQPVGSPRQLNYLKQHLQHKGGYQQGSTPPPQGFGNGPGPGIHSPMGPPSHHMGPPSSMPPPGTPQGMMDPMSGASMHHPEGMVVSQDNGMPNQASHQATSLITTGPDGASLDEASQQSTLSNTSIGK